LSEDIKRIFKKSRSTYGSPRMQRVLREEGKCHGRGRLRRLMKKLNLQPKAARRFKVTTDSQHNKPVAPNILGQQFSPPAANITWAADITYIRTGEGWLYLATVIDLYSRRIIGWSMGTSLKTNLVADALTMAITKRKPPKGVIHHSDRGSQYCSDAYQAQLLKHGFICSMSGKGNCYDNAVMESFYHTLKVELVYGQRYQTRGKAQTAIFDYIEIFYNRQRIHSSLNYQTPEAFERAA
jgi:putative transposase